MKNDLFYYGLSFMLPPLVVLFFQIIFNRIKKDPAHNYSQWFLYLQVAPYFS